MTSFFIPSTNFPTTATGAVTLAVSVTGSDVSVNRPTTIVSGDYSAFPFATISGAISSLPKNLGNFNHKITNQSGTFTGFMVDSFVGSGSLYLLGTTALSTVTTGVNTGTAGSGTTSTAVKKPAAAANWTVSDLRGKTLLITGGGGFYADTAANISTNGGPCQRVIKDNTIDTISIDALTGLDNTTTFQIIDPVTFVTQASQTYGSGTFCIGLASNSCRIIMRGFKPSSASALYGIFGQSNVNSEVYGCNLVATGFAGTGFYDSGNLTFKNNYLSGGSQSYAELLGGTRVTCSQNIEDNSRIEISNYLYVNGNIDAKACSGNAVKLMNSHYVSMNVSATGCTATPVVLQALHQFSGILTGTNASVTYGVSVSGGGQYVLTGSDITSTSGPLALEGNSVDWATVALGTYATRGNFVYWGSGSLRFSDELIGLSGVTSGGILKSFGQNLDLGDSAAIGITAHAGGGQGSAVTCGWQFTSISTVASHGDSVILRAYAAGGGGCIIANLGANNAAVFPASGGTINGGGANSSVTLTAGSWAIVKTTTDGTTYRLKAIT